MSYNIVKPSPILSKFVKHYWALENCTPEGKEHLQRIVPCGLTELIFYLGDKPESTDRNKPISDYTLLSGQLNNYYDIKVTGHLSLFSVIFQPHGLSQFFDLPIKELFNQNVPLKYLLGDSISELETKLYKAQSFAEKITIAEHFLFERLNKYSPSYHFNRIEHSINLINQSKGQVDIKFLASETCFSRKQYERTFADFVGASPRQFLKIVRFQHTIHEKSKNKNASLTNLAHRCGYYDQSHMINDFLKLSGLTPKQYFNECEPFSDYFQ